MDESSLIRLPEVSRRVGLRKTKIYAMIKEGDFPKPVKCGMASLWPSEKVSDWIASQ